jgi:L-asparagine transporter-like permease
MSEEKGALHGEELERGLEERHIQLMAIGGAIGVGLFLGSATAIKTAGPALLLAYAGGGFILYIIMRALGEMATEHPIAGSFAAYAYTYISPLLGFMTGWSYWFMWVVTCMAEVTAVGIYVQFWAPSFPQWLTAFIAIVLLSLVNLTAASLFGEFEFWFALIKVVTIIIMIVVGLIMMFTGLGNNGVAVGFTNLYSLPGGFFPKGIWGPVQALVMVTFAFLGIELIGVTAGEAKNPDKVIPSAIKKVFWRIMIFYVGALTVIMSLYPWTEIGTKGSPFVMTFASLGIAAAAGIINFVVLTSASSSCNSGIFTTGRMLYSLALEGKAPKYFAQLSKSKVPARGIIFSAACMMIGVVLNFVVPAEAFNYVTSIATFVGIFVWFVITWCQMNFRKTLTPEQVKNLKFPMFGFPIANYIAMGFLGLVIAVMCIQPGNRVAVIVGIPWLLVLWLIYKFKYAKDEVK